MMHDVAFDLFWMLVDQIWTKSGDASMDMYLKSRKINIFNFGQNIFPPETNLLAEKQDERCCSQRIETEFAF